MRNLIICSIVLFSYGCSYDEGKISADSMLKRDLVELDSSIRMADFNQEEIFRILYRIDSGLINSKGKSFRNNAWETRADFHSSSDSSIVLIRSIKTHKLGFKREIILNMKDTCLLIQRFEVVTEVGLPGYELLETFNYLTASRNIKNLVRREYPRAIKDTIHLRTLPFLPYKSDLENEFDSELSYSKEIMAFN